MSKEPLDWSAIRARLEGERGQAYWRSLEEVAGTPEFQAMIGREFGDGVTQIEHAISRRRFLQLMGASIALAGLTACVVVPREKLVPYVRSPEELVPGQPLFFATAMPQGGYAFGALAESHMGRPTKIEGNPDHPATLGATDPFMQASVLGLYDPDRSQVVTHRGEVSTWGTFQGLAQAQLMKLRASRGAGLRLVTETVTSPTLLAQIQDLLRRYPGARWIQYEPAPLSPGTEGTRRAFGADVVPHYRLDTADVVVSLDADFLAWGPAKLRYAREFSDRRRARKGATDLNRLYTAECSPTLDGAMADHRVAVRPRQLEPLVRAIASRLGLLPAEATEGLPTAWIDAVSRDLAAHRGRSVVIPGEAHGPGVHVLAHAINHALGNLGTTVTFTAPVARAGDGFAELRTLTDEMRAGSVDTVLILGGNPVYTAPADLGFAEALGKVPYSLHLGLYHDETAAACLWHVPETHYLEAWSDARAYDGTASIIQPLIAPLYDGKSAHEVLALFNDQPEVKGHDLIQATWRGGHAGNFDAFWQNALNVGTIPGTALPTVPVTFSGAALGALPAPAVPSGLELVFRPDPSVWDGRYSNNGWLQELPKPLTKLTWDNAALISPGTAERLGLTYEDVVELGYEGRSVKAPIWIVPGHPDDVVTATLGYGRQRTGKVGMGTGFDANRIRTSQSPWHAGGVTIKKTGETYRLVTTQHHQSMDGQDIVRTATLGEFERQPTFAQTDDSFHLPTLYPDYPSEGYAWAMVIDLNTCIGCNACVVACQAENNIPVVGKEEVNRNRQMHWLRIDRYYQGKLYNPKTSFMPVPCMHCEKAPCELVCPTEATIHDSEGLNEMVYQRCIGTRFCSNNCPYKVRRFNFFQYSDYVTPSLVPLRNPDVTVRSRGVMEKCTYCIQRINSARVTAEEEDRRIRDGEVRTACQSACPTRAIVFGDLNDPASAVRKDKAEPLNYALLGELSTRPRTTYLAQVTNPNPELGSV